MADEETLKDFTGPQGHVRAYSSGLTSILTAPEKENVKRQGQEIGERINAVVALIYKTPKQFFELKNKQT